MKPHIIRLLLIAINLFVLTIQMGHAQTMQLEVIGGAVVTQGSTISINAGTSLDFRITNVDFSNCKKLKIQDVDISNTTDFDIDPTNPKKNIKPEGCNGGKKFLDFTITNISPNCTTVNTLVTVEIKDQADFTFTLEVTSSPEIYVFGANYPFGDIFHGDTTTSENNNTYFGVVEEGATVTRRYAVANIGSCDLDITALASSNSDFAVSSPYPIPWTGLAPYYYIVIDVTFTAPVAGTGTQSSVISVSNTDNTTFTFTVSAEMFNENIPGPGGITANFKLWLKSTRGIVTSGSALTDWQDLGTNGKDATTVTGKEPTYYDTAAENINYNPVVDFENDGGATEQYMYNDDTPISGFYNHEIFIVVQPDVAMSNSSSGETIFAGIDSGSAGDKTGVGFGDYSTEFTDEILSYNQDIPGGGSFNGDAETSTSKTYSGAGIINIRNNASSSPTGQEILYNSVVQTTSNVSDVSFTNIDGSDYWVGRNYDVQGSLNGKVAEVFTFSEVLSAIDRQKVESYLAIKYGVTLGASTEAQKDYVNSFDNTVWDISGNTGFNYHVAGIGRDSISDLNQKQSKTLNLTNEVTIGLGGVYATNSTNTSEFTKDGDFLVWGNNNGAFSGTSSNTVTIATGITTSLTRIDRKYKIVEDNDHVDGDVGTVYLTIPAAAFSGFSKTSSEEYALIVADNSNFANGDIIDVIPLRSEDAGVTLQTFYNFDGTKYFTFGKVAKLSDDHAISFASGDYMVGEYALNLNTDDFTISAWVKCAANASDRTIMAKGEKLQIRLNPTGNVEVYIDDEVTPKYTSDMDIDDGKWHHTTFIYNSGTILLYVDGVLDKSVQNIVHPSPNSNHYSIGALYIDKDNISNYLLGEIDEVVVWDVALTESQLRYVMNQEIERYDDSGTDYIQGKLLPQGASSNEIASIPWSSLRVYYDFNNFYGSTVEGLTDDRFFIRLNYLNKTKTMLDDQTAPLPYVSAADGAWDTASTWSNSADVMVPNSLSLDGSTIIDWHTVQIGHNITSGDRDISVFGLVQTSGTLTIADPVDTQDETNSGQSLTILNYLEIDGVIDLVGESQLVQDDGSVIDADSGGYLERDQQGTASGFNYNYWSSSVGPIAGNTGTRGTGAAYSSNHTLLAVLNDGTTSSAYQSPNFSASHTAADSNTPTSPRTLSTHWMYTFYGADDDYDAWTSIDENSSLQPGEGFTMKGTSGAADIQNDLQNYVFKGIPNNGDITIALDNTSGEVDRLIGNPYPSAIDATEFILDNLSVADGGTNTNGTIFNGALYFWDHFGEEDSHYLDAYVGGYATRNLTGGTAAISNDSRINNTSDGGSAATGTKVPGQYIAVNQGFFVSTALDGFNNDNGDPIATVDGGNIVFKNSQRVFVTEEVAASSQFLRNVGNKNKSAKNNAPKDAKISLIYDSPMGYHRQILLGTRSEATESFDLGYDAYIIDINEEDMYWLLDTKKLVIQGVNELLSIQEFPLGLIVNQDGIVTIRMNEMEGVEHLQISILDKNTGEYHNIKNSPFITSLEVGTYEDRFKLVFKEIPKEEEEELISDENTGLLTYFDKENSEIVIQKGEELIIQEANLYNLTGQKVATPQFLNNRAHVNLSAGIYIITFNTTEGGITKKIRVQ